MPRLYHFTSGRHLRGIHRYGLTVGDVPTDLDLWRGRVGVWLTSSEVPDGHGLEESVADKKRYRLAVDLPDDLACCLVRWTDWAPGNVTAKTIRILHQMAPDYASWFVFFGTIAPTSISACVDMATGREIRDWADCSPPELDVKGVPPWRRDAWHRALMKRLRADFEAYRSRIVEEPRQ